MLIHYIGIDFCSSYHKALASMARRIYTTYTDPEGLSAFLACQLIKILVSDQLVWGRYILLVDHCSNVQGNKVVVRQLYMPSVKKIYEDSETDGIILVDASNAFNNLNQRVALLINIRYLCHHLSNW